MKSSEIKVKDWVETELMGADFGDDRLDKRAMILLERLGDNLSVSIPAACFGLDETLAAYRFFDNQKVTSDLVLASHRDATIRRMAKHDKVFLVQDTTELDYTGKASAQSVGSLGWGGNRRGMFAHVSLAVTPQRVCLGVTDAAFWSRDDNEPDNDARKQKPIQEKESFRWVEGYDDAGKIAAQMPETMVVMMADREGDIYELFLKWQNQNEFSRAEFIVRACQNRKLAKQENDQQHIDKKLWDCVEKSPVLGSVEFELPKAHKREKRQITQTIQAMRVCLNAPWRTDKKLPEVEVNAVLAREVNPPKDVAPVEWMILTSLPVETFEQACDIINSYLCRWQIEVFFKVLKSGCQIEELQLETEERLKPCIALYMIISWRTLFVTMLSRQKPDEPCTVLFEDDEWKPVYRIVKQQDLPKKIPTLGKFIIMLASLGGYLNRKGDRPPGNQCVWIGLRRMIDFTQAWRAFGPERKGQTYV